MKVKKTYRLEEETIRELEKLCEATGKTATEVIEAAIRDAIREPYDESGPDRVGDGWAQTVAALTEQLAVKDGQIASLGRALESAQETAKAAQALHAANVQERALGSGGERGPSLAVALEQRVTPSTQNSIETMAGNLPGHRFYRACFAISAAAILLISS